MNDTIERLVRAIASDLDLTERAYHRQQMDDVAIRIGSAQSFVSQLLQEIEYQKYRNRTNA